MVLRMVNGRPIPKAVNGSMAPVCPVVRSQVPFGRPPTRIPTVRPTDLPSVINTVNQIITFLNGTDTQNNLVLYPYMPDWVEIHRVVNTVRVYNPNDQEMWVDVERISNLVFKDRSTDALFEWEY